MLFTSSGRVERPPKLGESCEDHLTPMAMMFMKTGPSKFSKYPRNRACTGSASSSIAHRFTVTFLVFGELLRNRVAKHSFWGLERGAGWTGASPNYKGWSKMFLGDGFPHRFYLRSVNRCPVWEGRHCFSMGVFFFLLTSLMKCFWFQSRFFFSATFKQLVCKMTFYIFSKMKQEPPWLKSHENRGVKLSI